MDKKTLEQFKQQLESMREEIYQDVNKTLNEMNQQNDNIPDPNDRATMESDRNFELKLRSREEKLMNKITQALARIDNGTYGCCAECNDNISIARLQARPVAELCIECKTKQERMEKEQGR